ncbi:MAG: 6-phosphofructokinase, partial [Blastocatellia bacterium]|nr:6-phosphofructokinase [Blastocatellia bacterium]
MSKEIKTIGILTGGGDAPGLNAVIRAVVKTLISRYQIRVIGIEDGFQGLIDPVKMRELTTDSVRGLLPRGGTILGTRNKGDFVLKHEGDQVIRPEGVFEKAIENLQKNGIDALVILGGDGTQTIALEFHKMGFPIV